MKKNQFEEVPGQRKIIENRRFAGKLKVFAVWYLFWNTLHQIAFDLFSALVLCNITLSICPNSDRPILRGLRILLAGFTSILHMNERMNRKAKERWKLKYTQSQTLLE